MKRPRFSEEQIIAIVRAQEAGPPTAEVSRSHGISTATLFTWKVTQVLARKLTRGS